MRRVVVTAAIAMLLSAGAEPASAQTWSAGGTAGFGQTWDDEGSIGKGWFGGGFADVRLFGRTDVEVSVDVLTHDRSGRFEAKGHTTLASAVLRQRFGGNRAYGFVLGGLTLASHDGTAGFPEDGLVTHNSSTNSGWIFGGGAMFRAGEQLELGPVVRMTILSTDRDSDPFSTIMVGVRVGVGSRR